MQNVYIKQYLSHKCLPENWDGGKNGCYQDKYVNKCHAWWLPAIKILPQTIEFMLVNDKWSDILYFHSASAYNCVTKIMLNTGHMLKKE